MSLESNQQEEFSYVHSLANLDYCLNNLVLDEMIKEQSFREVNESVPDLTFSEAEIQQLWETLSLYLTQTSDLDLNAQSTILESALQHYLYYLEESARENPEKAVHYLNQSKELVHHLWLNAIQLVEKKPEDARDALLFSILRSRLKDNDNLAHLDHKIREKMRPYVITSTHPMKAVLDNLFYTRVTLNEKTLKNAGFTVLHRQTRSFICVVSHPELSPDYLIKLHYDNDTREKHKKPTWHWMVQRCIGAEKVQKVIDKYRLKKFLCAKKWLYPLPEHPSPPSNSKYTKHLCVLLVTDMHLVPANDNYHLWKTAVTTEILDELLILITYGGNHSLRPDNMPFTTFKKIAWIDTEYPDRGPDYKSIRKYLNDTMREYWDKIVKKGL